MEHLSAYFFSLVEHTSYAGLFLVAVLGNLAVPVGLEIVLPLVGALVATGHIESGPLAFVAALLGEVVGASLLWAVGRYGGTAFVHRFGRYVHLDAAALTRVHGFYERYGARTVFFCRFIPVIRGVAALPAGLSGMSIYSFLAYSFAGSAIFCAGLIALGYKIGRRIDTVLPLVHKTGSVLLGAAVLVIIVAVVVQRRRGQRAGVAAAPLRRPETP